MSNTKIERADVQPQREPCSASSNKGTKVIVTKVAPHQSIRCGCLLTARIFKVLLTTYKAKNPIGTLTKNTHRHPVRPRIESWPAKNPPIMGPKTLAEPNTAMKYA